MKKTLLLKLTSLALIAVSTVLVATLPARKPSFQEEAPAASQQMTDALSMQVPAPADEQTEKKQAQQEQAQQGLTQQGLTQQASEKENSTTKKTDAAEEISQVYSAYIVNPLYAGLSDSEADAKQDEVVQAASPNAPEVFQDVQAAASYMRTQMVNRVETISFQVPASLVSSNGAFAQFVNQVVEAATAYSDACSGTEGDALTWGYRNYKAASTGSSAGCQVTFTFTYHSTYEQEQALTAGVNSALAGMNLTGKSDYEKVRAIHDYICDNVDYDYDLKKYSAYDALCTKQSVCQGYAVLFYRMCKEAGLSVRVIGGTGNGGRHGWNIVKLGETGKYYNIDCTWDGQSATTHHTYFLKYDADFVNHARDTEYDTAAFHAAFPMAERSYSFTKSINVPNLRERMWVYDGVNNDTDIYMTAQGRPKVLIFIQTSCVRSKGTVQSVAREQFGDSADIYVISADAYGDREQKLGDFIRQTAPGNNEITFGLQIGNAWNNYFDFAVAHAGWKGTENTPTICYIDANDNVRHMTYGQQTATAIRNNLNEYCNGAGNTRTAFTITYAMDGGTNDTGNPSAYMPDTGALALRAPTKAGFTFKGWYTDDKLTQPITEITKKNSGNLTLYAKWEANPAPPADFPKTDMTLSDGNILMGISGTCLTESADAILTRLNQIRLEACTEGVMDAYLNRRLTPEDYVPLKWSSDLEAITRLRAAEAAVRMDHTRPNGRDFYTARTIGKKFPNAENLAWTSNIMAGIELWYQEKADWVSGNKNKETGHYLNLITPTFHYVAVSAFRISGNYPYALSIAQEFSMLTELDSQKSDSAGTCVQAMEVAGSAVTGLSFDTPSLPRLNPGDSHKLSLNATAEFDSYPAFKIHRVCTGAVYEGGKWESSDAAVASVDADGTITAVKSGTATISVTIGNATTAITVEVAGEGGGENDSDDKPGDDKPGDDKPGDDKPGDDKPGDDGQKPADGDSTPSNPPTPPAGDAPDSENGSATKPGDAPGGSDIPAPETGKPFIKGEDGQSGWDVVRAKEETAGKGSVITLDMNGTTMVPGDIFERIKGRDVAMIFDMGNGVAWSAGGQSVTADKVGDIDFSVKTGTNAIPLPLINDLSKGNYATQLSLAHEGEFGFTATLSINLGKENAGLIASLYYYNKSSGKLEPVSMAEIAKDGTVGLAFTHASDYVVVVNKDAGGGNESEAAEKTDLPSQTPQTGSPRHMMALVTALLVASICAFFAAARRKRAGINQRDAD